MAQKEKLDNEISVHFRCTTALRRKLEALAKKDHRKLNGYCQVQLTKLTEKK